MGRLETDIHRSNEHHSSESDEYRNDPAAGIAVRGNVGDRFSECGAFDWGEDMSGHVIYGLVLDQPPQVSLSAWQGTPQPQPQRQHGVW